MRRRSGLTSANITTAVTSNTPVTMLKSVSSGIELKNPADHPASLLPNAFERNQTPIIKPTMRTGDTLVTALSPTGYRHTSPNSASRYTAMSHNGLMRVPPSAWAIAPAGTSTRNPRPMNRTPRAILAGTDGSRGPSRTHIHAKIGAKMTTKIGGTDWNHDEGNENPKTSRRV